MKITHVEIEEYVGHWDVLFQLDDVPFRFIVDVEKGFINDFSHFDGYSSPTCPLCQQRSSVCGALLRDLDRVHQVVSNVLEHPMLRMKVVTETNLDVENLSFRVGTDRGWIGIYELKTRLQRLQAAVGSQQYHIIHVTHDGTKAVVNQLDSTHRYAVTIDQKGKKDRLPLSTMFTESHNLFLDPAFLHPFISVLTPERDAFFKTVQKVKP